MRPNRHLFYNPNKHNTSVGCVSVFYALEWQLPFDSIYLSSSRKRASSDVSTQPGQKKTNKQTKETTHAGFETLLTNPVKAPFPPQHRIDGEPLVVNTNQQTRHTHTHTRTHTLTQTHAHTHDTSIQSPLLRDQHHVHTYPSKTPPKDLQIIKTTRFLLYLQLLGHTAAHAPPK